MLSGWRAGACGGAAGPLRWRPVTHRQRREARPQSAPFTAALYTHTQALKHTHPLKCQQTHGRHACPVCLAHTHFPCPVDRERGAPSTGALRRYQVKKERKRPVCTSLVGPRGPQGFFFFWCVCLCARVWAGRLL